ncbi:RNA polymerase sigma-70 factor (ECF subfamily) [Stackebrandtia albiflava]|uniref:RNA polymerase sigma-70 factor (ECF subfamily) n=1 Tax=Stackebrandtia albiflava TaxID=406432 RepID=A0A562VCK6_9ACTN|nr:RNA polymerase sigma-70 factor [Stackebrandtia albiflava]TWJ15614.1 RNA polymerase sigma-70 factor (ECF subfamily) [Stackebrandtia albiflava]
MRPADETFQQHRRLLVSVAYRILGSVGDAEDAVQDGWIRWSGVDPETVREPRAYLVRLVANAALNRLRAVKARRESYPGPWLPEPVLTDPADAAAEAADSISMAMMIVLETLTPDERAVFVLREAFGFSYREIAAALHRTPESVRQLSHRARSHVHARRPRFAADRAAHRAAAERFHSAARGGDLAALLDVLAPDVVLRTDGGGRVRAALRGIHGADKVSRFILAVMSEPVWSGVNSEAITTSVMDVNAMPGLVMRHGDRPVAAVSLEVEDGRITEVNAVMNPEKLNGVLSAEAHPGTGPPKGTVTGLLGSGLPQPFQAPGVSGRSEAVFEPRSWRAAVRSSAFARRRRLRVPVLYAGYPTMPRGADRSSRSRTAGSTTASKENRCPLRPPCAHDTSG